MFSDYFTGNMENSGKYKETCQCNSTTHSYPPLAFCVVGELTSRINSSSDANSVFIVCFVLFLLVLREAIRYIW